MPQLTILMPAYNSAPFIKEAVDSLLHQQYSDFELWIVNDGSTDETRDIISTYSDARIRVFNQEVNQGRDHVVNRFAKQISTPFFTITDADDVSHPQRLQKQLNLLQNDAALMMCGTSYITIDQNGYTDRTVWLPDTYEEVIENMAHHAQFHGPTTIMRSRLLDSNAPLYRQDYFDAFADADLCSRIASASKAINLKEPLYFYRVVPDSMSRKNITAFGLNYYLFIHWLYQQRVASGKDVLQSGDFGKAEQYKQQIAQSSSSSSFYRQLAFTHLYWGLLPLAITSISKACVRLPWQFKNTMAFFYILFRSTVLHLKKQWHKVHYREMMQSSS